MSARLVGDSQVPAGLPPFGAVWRNPAAAGAELGEQMGQLMAQGAVDLRGVMLAQARIERDKFAAKIRAAGGAEKARVPFHLHRGREFRRVECLQQLSRFPLESGITAEHDERADPPKK